jgi:FAD/FMN-containing dehydrogenase
VTIFSALRSEFGENIQAYETMSQDCVDVVLRYAPKCSAPLESKSPWYLLVEITGSADHLRAQIEDFLAAMFEKNLLQDATIAQNETQRKNFWLLREEASPGARYYPGGSIKHDVSVPIAAMPDFVREANAVASKIVPKMKPAIFGHAGDGNLHYDLCQDAGLSNEEFLAMWDQVSHAVHDVAAKYNGSMAAEHGVGAFKVDELAQRKSTVEMELMHKVKQALDPQGLMNPGAVLK